MLVREAGEDHLTVKLIDFGLAKSLVEEGVSVVNVTGTGFLGTPLYASPEQCEEMTPDIRPDIYSLGVTLWFVLAGCPPFTGGWASFSPSTCMLRGRGYNCPLPFPDLFVRCYPGCSPKTVPTDRKPRRPPPRNRSLSTGLRSSNYAHSI